MTGNPFISSNNAIFRLQQRVIRDRSFRRQEGLIWMEGPRLLSQIKKDDIKALFLGPEAEEEPWPVAPHRLSADLAKKVFETDNPQEVGFLISWKSNVLADLDWHQGVMIVDGLQDPGNTGSLVRTAAGLGFGGFVLLSSVDAGNTKLVRASAGCLLNIPIHECRDRNELQSYLKKQKIEIYLADCHRESRTIKKPAGSFACVIGNEARGLSEDWQGHIWSLALQNNVESLNAATAGALLAYTLKI